MAESLQERVDRYDAGRPLSGAATMPASWYVDPDIAELERRTVFSQAWQVAGRFAQVRTPGEYLTTAGLAMRADDRSIRCKGH